jgi:SWI/SNF-related matrix-associated actin-dependent regulator 1 of chromatin subfamily A
LEFVPFDDATRKVYDSILAAHIERRKNASMAINASAQQHLFTALRKAANHPLLLRTRHTSSEAISHLAGNLFQFGYFGRHETCTERHVRQELESFSDFDVHCAALELLEENPMRRDELSRYTLAEEDLFSSPKFVRLRVLLPELIENGHRVLVFSQWTRCLDLLGCLMESLNMECLRLDGSTAISERQKLIDRFNQDSSISVFLLSTRAGGMGINLTAADVCILHDLDFNPFNDVQAEDRCHRIGQTKPVTIYKMVTEGTVDADIYEMQQRKARMNAAILESSKEVAKNKEDDADINDILQSAVNRFLQSPEPKAAYSRPMKKH